MNKYLKISFILGCFFYLLTVTAARIPPEALYIMKT